MKIVNISYELGNRVVSNEDLIKYVKRNSPDFQVDHSELDEVLPKLFEKAGCNNRRWCDNDQRAIDMTTRVFRRGLEESNTDPKKIELIIHAGLGRGFLEAGQSYFVAKAMGMEKAHCFDVMDACQSWVRSLCLANSLLKSGQYSKIAIVNTECNQAHGGTTNPVCFQLRSLRDLDFCFPGMTLGEGVSVTIVEASDEHGWRFDFESIPSLADACAVPIHRWDLFAQPSYLLAQNGEGKFTCFGKQLNAAGNIKVKEIMRRFEGEWQKSKWVFAHGHSTFWTGWAQEIGLNPEKLKWNTFPEIGNLASACLPVSIRMAEDAGEFGQGDQALLWMGSGGMSFSVSKFVR